MPGSNGNSINSALNQSNDVGSPVDETTGGASWLNNIGNLGGLGSPISALIGAGANIIMNERNNRANERLQAQANQRNIDLWRMQTNYNTPANQIARLKEAGLNPNLIYGNPNNTASSAPDMKAPELKASQFNPMDFVNALLVRKQLQMQDAEIANIEADTRQKNASATGQENENSIFNLRVDEVLQNLNIGNETIKEIKSRVDLNTKKGQHEYQLALKAEIERKFDEASFSNRLFLLEQQGLLTSEQVKVAQEQQKQIRATISQIYANIELMKAQKKLVDQQILTEIAETALRENGLDLQKSQIDLNRAMQFMYGALQGKYNSESALNNLKGQLVQAQTRGETAKTIVYEMEHGVSGSSDSIYFSAPILSVIYSLIEMIPG